MLKEIKRQNLLIFMCWLIYVASYISRYSYNANIVSIIDFYNIDKSTTGLVSTFFFFAYGCGQILNGILCKRYNKKYILSGSLIISSICNLILFTQPSIAIYKYVWLINGISLSVLWSLLILTLSQNLDDKKLNTAIFWMSTTVAVGTVITYGCSSLFNLIASYKYSFLLGGVISLIVGLLWFFLSNKLLSNNNVIDKKNDEATIDSSKTKVKISTFAKATLVLFGVFMIVDNLVKDGTSTWVPAILKDTYDLGNSLSIILTLTLPILGMFGSVFVIKMSKIIKNEILLNGVMFVISTVLTILILLFLKKSSFIFIIIIFGLLSMMMHAINSFITSFLPLKLRGKFNSGILAGVLNGCGYIGSTISAYCLSLIADNSGWNGVFILLVTLCAVSTILCLGYFLFTKIKKQEEVI